MICEIDIFYMHELIDGGVITQSAIRLDAT